MRDSFQFDHVGATTGTPSLDMRILTPQSNAVASDGLPRLASAACRGVRSRDLFNSRSERHENYRDQDIRRGRRMEALGLRQDRDRRGGDRLRRVQRRQESVGRGGCRSRPEAAPRGTGSPGLRDAVLGHDPRHTPESGGHRGQGHRRRRAGAPGHQGLAPWVFQWWNSSAVP